MVEASQIRKLSTNPIIPNRPTKLSSCKLIGSTTEQAHDTLSRLSE
jgi:hypothetical protein